MFDPRTSLLHEGLEHDLKFGTLLLPYRGLWFVGFQTLWSIRHGITTSKLDVCR